MKTKFLFTFLLNTLLFNLNAQQNVVVPAASPTPSTSNVLIGPPGTSIVNSGAGATGGYNVLIGLYGAASSITTGQVNVVIGAGSGQSLSTGNENTFAGYFSGNQTTGSFNSFFGRGAGYKNTSGYSNTCIGANAGSNLGTGYNNAFMGVGAGTSNFGYNNTFLGVNSGLNSTSGSGNSFLGYVQVSATASTLGTPSTPGSIGNDCKNSIILADGAGTQRLIIDELGYTGLGFSNNQRAKNVLEINSLFQSSYTASNSSGLRFRNLKNNIAPITNPSTLADKGVLSVNADGDVILVKDNGGGINNNCSGAGGINYITKNSDLAGNLSCSQIFDNTSATVPIAGSTVSIGYTTQPANFNFDSSSILLGGLIGTSFNGVLKLSINGVTRGTSFFATSDKKFKKDIKPIENAIEIIEKLNGKTYLWNSEKYKEMNFDNGKHSGFIAQELEKVLPHLVITTENGDKAANYLEVIPYLVEGMKEQQKLIDEQQIQINELKNLVLQNLKPQNSDLLNLEENKILFVSPNPSNNIITVTLSVIKSAQEAFLQVHDINGKIVSNLIINERSTSLNKTLLKENFGDGIYFVCLVINGKNIDTKKIIFN